MNTDPIQPMLPFGQQTVPSADERSTTAAWAQETTQEMAKRPHIFVALAQNALIVAHSLRDNYFRNTAVSSNKLCNFTDLCCFRPCKRRFSREIPELSCSRPGMAENAADGRLKCV